MKRLVLDPACIDRSVIEDAARLLRAGGLVAFPTETVYGLGALGLDPRALGKIFAAKGRPATNPLILHVLCIAEAASLVTAIPAWAYTLAEAFWPGPLTFVLPRSARVPVEATGGQRSVAVRAPSNAIARALLEAVGAPIAAPSANRYQAVSPTDADHVVASLGDRVDLVLDGGPCAIGLESTVVTQMTEHAHGIRILRPGSISQKQIADRLPEYSVHFEEGTIAQAEHAAPGMDALHYAPNARLILTANVAEALRHAEARSAAGTSGVLSFGEFERSEFERHPNMPLFHRALGATPEVAAHALYRALHAADADGVGTLYVEEPPSGPEWAAVRDRLRRAVTRPT
jgi:L-threonylcarbamoyladenylate synthase